MCDNPSLESRVEEGFPGKMRMSHSEVIWGQSVLSVRLAHAKALRWEGAERGSGRGYMLSQHQDV